MVNHTIRPIWRVLRFREVADAGAVAMTIEAWAVFAATALTLMAMPGPTNLVLVSYGLTHGRAAVWPAVLGVTLGRLAALALAVLGAGTLLATWPPLLASLKVAGIAYLLWLGVRLWRAGDRLPAARGVPGVGTGVEPEADVGAGPATGTKSRGRVLRHVWVVTVLNPFNVAYVTALLPDPSAQAEQTWLGAAVMAATFLGLSFAVSLLYGLLAAQAHRLWTSRRVVLGCNRVGGALLVGGAAALATGT